MTKPSIPIIITIVILMVGTSTIADSEPIANRKVFNSCFKEYVLSYVRNELNPLARQYSENKTMTGMDVTTSSTGDSLFSLYNYCICGLAYPIIDLNITR
jgi:hypothetical protein